MRAKDYLYALRALFAARWVARDLNIPPVPFADLPASAPAEVLGEVPALLAHKARTGEGERMARVPVLDAFLQSVLAEVEECLGSLPQGTGGTTMLDRLLRAEIREPRTAPPQSAEFTLDHVRSPDLLLFDTV